MGKPVFIFHFSPPELYPPIQNFINHVAGSPEEKAIYVFTTHTNTNLPSCHPKHKVCLKRFGISGQQVNAVLRYWTYLYYHIASLLYLIVFRPQAVLYYETISAFPAFFYKKFINRKARIHVHYHEYTTPGEYKAASWIVRRLYALEKKLLPETSCVSHTNEQRMALFQKDVLPVVISQTEIVPNYPPSSWSSSKQERRDEKPLPIVYVGALSLHTMYTKEFAQWVERMDGRVAWHIYSYNITQEAKEYLSSLKSLHIHLHNGIAYDQLPEILKSFVVGVILYKGHIENYIHNAPNKLFEYLACGLQVWYPNVMTGIHQLRTLPVSPRLLSLDFTAMDDFDPTIEVAERNTVETNSSFYCEPVYERLWSRICQ